MSKLQSLDSVSAPNAGEAYAQARLVKAGTDLLFISGQIAQDLDGNVPDDFEAQCRLAWTNICHQLAAADMTVENLVQVRTFLSDRKYAAANGPVRKEFLAGNRPANTTVVVDILDSQWLLEIEAVAAK